MFSPISAKYSPYPITLCTSDGRSRRSSYELPIQTRAFISIINAKPKFRFALSNHLKFSADCGCDDHAPRSYDRISVKAPQRSNRNEVYQPISQIVRSHTSNEPRSMTRRSAKTDLTALKWNRKGDRL